MSKDATESVRKDWDSQADNWYKQRELLLTASRPIHEWMVDQLEPKDGQRILEIAAGPGDTGFLAAARLGSGRLVSTDISEPMIDAARKRGAELGVTNVDYQVLDAQTMDLGSGSFDGILCRWGFMLMPDPAAAFRECYRVLAPGGRLVFAVFTGPDENPWASIPSRIFVEAGHLPKPTEEWKPGILALGDRARLEKLLDDIGFAYTRLEGINMTWAFPGVDEYWNFLVDLTALGPLTRSLSESDRNAVREEINRRLVPYSSADGIALPARCWGGVAVR